MHWLISAYVGKLVSTMRLIIELNEWSVFSNKLLQHLHSEIVLSHTVSLAVAIIAEVAVCIVLVYVTSQHNQSVPCTGFVVEHKLRCRRLNRAKLRWMICI